MTETPKGDPLKPIYQDSFIENPKREKDLRNRDTALLCIDMQYLDAAEGHGLCRDYEKSPIPLEEMQYYFSQLRDTVLPNVHNLQNCFRFHDLEVIHVRIQSLTRDGRDRSKGHKRLELHAAPGSGEACFLEEVAPVGDEIVINKTASGVFSSTNLHYVLNNLGISSLYVVGVYTNECVETTVRDACDLGYFVTLVNDGCTTVTPELHEASLKTLRNRYARIVSTAEAMDDIEQHLDIESLPLLQRACPHLPTSLLAITKVERPPKKARFIHRLPLTFPKKHCVSATVAL